ncbi:MAG TPA: hypothetical protein VKW06_12765 [Candidatus Angelobacter sp.]|nr:hypothetical protein [Candidatus Angelobacter sp.]
MPTSVTPLASRVQPVTRHMHILASELVITRWQTSTPTTLKWSAGTARVMIIVWALLVARGSLAATQITIEVQDLRTAIPGIDGRIAPAAIHSLATGV